MNLGLLKLWIFVGLVSPMMSFADGDDEVLQNPGAKYEAMMNQALAVQSDSIILMKLEETLLPLSLQTDTSRFHTDNRGSFTNGAFREYGERIAGLMPHIWSLLNGINDANIRGQLIQNFSQAQRSLERITERARGYDDFSWSQARTAKINVFVHLVEYIQSLRAPGGEVSATNISFEQIIEMVQADPNLPEELSAQIAAYAGRAQMLKTQISEAETRLAELSQAIQQREADLQTAEGAVTTARAEADRVKDLSLAEISGAQTRLDARSAEIEALIARAGGVLDSIRRVSTAFEHGKVEIKPGIYPESSSFGPLFEAFEAITKPGFEFQVKAVLSQLGESAPNVTVEVAFLDARSLKLVRRGLFSRGPIIGFSGEASVSVTVQHGLQSQTVTRNVHVHFEEGTLNRKFSRFLSRDLGKLIGEISKVLNRTNEENGLNAFADLIQSCEIALRTQLARQ